MAGMFSVPAGSFFTIIHNDNKAPSGTVRPLHWRDLHEVDEKKITYLRDRGMKRFNHLTGHIKLSE